MWRSVRDGASRLKKSCAEELDSAESLARALLNLGGREAQVLELVFAEGYPRASVAGFLGISVTALETALLRAGELLVATNRPGQPTERVLERLREEGPALKTALAKERQRRDLGPEATRREWRRRVFLALLIAGTLFLYFRGGR